MILSATCFELATWEPPSVRLISCCTLPTAELDVARTSATFASPFSPASRCSWASGRYTSAVWPPSGGWTTPTTLKDVPFRDSVEPTFSPCFDA